MSNGHRQALGENKSCQEVNFDSMTEQIQADYLDRHRGVQPQTHQISQSDDSGAISTTYLGRNGRSRGDDIKAQEQFSIIDQSTTVGTLLDGTDCKIFLDSDATKVLCQSNTIIEIHPCMGCQCWAQGQILFKLEME